MIRRVVFLSVFIALMLGISTISHAQEVGNTSPQTSDEMANIPDEYIREADRIFNECQAQPTLNRYFNCECRSLAFLDKRIELGPFAEPTEIGLSIQNECRDAIGVAGDAYNECLNKANRFQTPGIDPEEYCSCVANSYVKTLNSVKPRINSYNIVQYQTMAYTACQRPNARPEGSVVQ